MKNKVQQVYDVAVAGSGIVGLAMAYHASKRGLKTAVFERNPAASGATVRNFGMIWPFGQPLETFDRAMRSREIWLELSAKAGFWAAIAAGAVVVVGTVVAVVATKKKSGRRAA